MKLEDVMALVHAGYTKDEISAMTTPEPAAPVPEPAAPAPEPTAPTPEPAAPVPEPAAPAPEPTAPAPEPTAPVPEPAAPVPEPAAPATQVSQTEALLREILGAVQMGNINKATIDPPVEKGADVVTARIIDPNYGKEK